VLLTVLAARGGESAPAAAHPDGATATERCQSAVLGNGYRIQFTRREIAGAETRLWLCAGAGSGYIGVPSEQIQSIEPLPDGALSSPSGDHADGQLLPADAKKHEGGAFTDLISNAAARHAIDPDFVASIVKAESGFNRAAISPRGAQGLMQLMPGTAASLGVGDAFDPAANIEGGTSLLRQLLDQYGGNAQKALAAYNAGPGRVKQFGGVPPFRETRDYIIRVIEDYNRKKLQQAGQTATSSK